MDTSKPLIELELGYKLNKVEKIWRYEKTQQNTTLKMSGIDVSF